jgi:hypothetical protein
MLPNCGDCGAAEPGGETGFSAAKPSRANVDNRLSTVECDHICDRFRAGAHDDRADALRRSPQRIIKEMGIA